MGEEKEELFAQSWIQEVEVQLARLLLKGTICASDMLYGY